MVPRESSLKTLKRLPISIDLIHKSHNAPVPYPTMLHSEQKYAHFCSEWSIMGYGTSAFWDLWNRSIRIPLKRRCCHLDDILVTDCTESYQNSSFCHHREISVVVAEIYLTLRHRWLHIVRASIKNYRVDQRRSASIRLVYGMILHVVKYEVKNTTTSVPLHVLWSYYIKHPDINRLLYATVGGAYVFVRMTTHLTHILLNPNRHSAH